MSAYICVDFHHSTVFFPFYFAFSFSLSHSFSSSSDLSIRFSNSDQLFLGFLPPLHIRCFAADFTHLSHWLFRYGKILRNRENVHIFIIALQFILNKSKWLIFDSNVCFYFCTFPYFSSFPWKICLFMPCSSWRRGTIYVGSPNNFQEDSVSYIYETNRAIEPSEQYFPSLFNLVTSILINLFVFCVCVFF